jgi:DNA invertase Pin-like site-specific DNA recombinase
MIRERQAEGIALAKQRGVYKRTPSLDKAQVDEVRRLSGQGVPKVALAKKFNVSARTIYSVEHGLGVYGK